MFTRCPTCLTVFRVAPAQLRVAQGQVRCGRCAAVFDALDSLADDAQTLVRPAGPGPMEPLEQFEPEVATPSLADRLLASQAEASPPADQDAADLALVLAAAAETDAAETAASTGPEPAEAGTSSSGPATVPDPTADEAADAKRNAATLLATAASDEPQTGPEAGSETEPQFARVGLPPAAAEALLLEEPESRLGRWLGGALLIVLLVTLLAGQWVYVQRVPLYERAELRPWLQRFCKTLHCSLPLARAPERIEVIDRMVREHPRVAQALWVDLAFVSRAKTVVAYPVLELRLSDMTGHRIAARRFRPEEYLAAGTDPRRGLVPDVPTHVTLEVLAPDTDFVSFQFEFL